MNKKIFIEAYLDNNLGDDLMVSGFIKEFSDFDFYMTTNKSIVINTFLKYDNVNFISKKQFNKDKYSAFAYVKIGGSIFQYRDSITTIKKFIKTLSIMKMKRKGVKFITVGSNLGPFYSSFSEFVAKFEIRNNDLITVRDKESFNMIKDKFMLNNVRIFDDLVFEVMRDQCDAVENLSLSNNLGISAYRSVNSPELNFEMYSGLTEIIIKLNEEKPIENLYLFSFDSEDENDLTAAFHIKEMLLKLNFQGNVEIVPYLGTNIDFFIRKYRKVDYMIAIRFHSAILCDIYKIPYIPIAYSNKLKNYVTDYDDTKDVFYINELSHRDFIASLSYDKFSFRSQPYSVGHLQSVRNILG